MLFNMKSLSNLTFATIAAIIVVATIEVMTYVQRAEAQTTPTYTFEERQTRALEQIATSLEELKQCGCK